MLIWWLTGNPGNDGHAPSNATSTGGNAIEPRPIKTEPDTPTLYSHHNIHTQVSTRDCIFEHSLSLVYQNQTGACLRLRCTNNNNYWCFLSRSHTWEAKVGLRRWSFLQEPILEHPAPKMSLGTTWFSHEPAVFQSNVSIRTRTKPVTAKGDEPATRKRNHTRQTQPWHGGRYCENSGNQNWQKAKETQTVKKQESIQAK